MTIGIVVDTISAVTHATPNTKDETMTLTHLSHFGLELLATTTTGAVLCGSLANCKRMAAAHGMEVDKYEGRLLSYVNGFATTAPVDMTQPVRITYKNGGMVQKCVDDYTLVIPMAVWVEKN